MGFWDANSDRDWDEWVHEYDEPRTNTRLSDPKPRLRDVPKPKPVASTPDATGYSEKPKVA